MALTPNYSFIIPTGTDAVNLLTQCYPNFSSLDTLLKPIQESGVTVATSTKVGTVHQLVRTDSSCNMFRFIATGNYASGDTFTVDGASVTATAVDGTSLPAGAFVINQSVVAVVNGAVLTVLVPGTMTLPTINASTVVYDNSVSGLTATDVQDAIDELHDSTNIAYDNTVSGLNATDVQSAIDEIVTSGGSEHGIYELWKNTTDLSTFSAGNVVLNSFDSTKWDAIIVAYAPLGNEIRGTYWNEFDKDVLSIPGWSGEFNHFRFLGSQSKIIELTRSISFSLAGTTLTVSFGGGKTSTANAVGTAATNANDDTVIVPIRILGLVHNN